VGGRVDCGVGFLLFFRCCVGGGEHAGAGSVGCGGSLAGYYLVL